MCITCETSNKHIHTLLHYIHTLFTSQADPETKDNAEFLACAVHLTGGLAKTAKKGGQGSKAVVAPIDDLWDQKEVSKCIDLVLGTKLLIYTCKDVILRFSQKTSAYRAMEKAPYIAAL